MLRPIVKRVPLRGQILKSFYSTTPTNGAAPVAPTPAPNDNDDSNKHSKQKSRSHWKFYAASLAIGALTAKFVPLFTLYELVTERLPEPNTPQAEKYIEKIETRLTELDLYKKLSENPEFESYRAWEDIDSSIIESSMSGTLTVPGGFAIKPVLFVNKKNHESVTIIHVGKRLCGYPFLVHGGILATILDENFKKVASLLYDKDKHSIRSVGLSLSYKAPTLADNFVVVMTKARLDDEGHVLMEGLVHSIKNAPLVKGETVLELPKSGVVEVLTKKRWSLW